MIPMQLPASLLLLIVSGPAMALPAFTAEGDLSAEGCAYGRGSVAVESAAATAMAEVASFLKSPKMFAETTSSESLDSATMKWFQQLHDKAVEGVQLQQMPVARSGSRIQGNDTCVTVTLAQGMLPETQNEDDGGWETDANEVTVTVTGEGWPDGDNELTARNKAELDALKRAVSQVVGVWLTQQRAQFSTMEQRSSENANNFALDEVVSQQLHTRSQGLVKEWSLLDFRKLDRDGVEVTIQAVVEKQKLAVAATDVLTAIGSPRVALQGPEQVVRPLKAWLNENGIEVGQGASLRILADSELRSSGDTQWLDLTVTVENLSGEQYALWRNDPSLLALPASKNVEADLIDVHLALPEQKAALHASLQEGFQAMVAQGGLIREVQVRKGLLREPDKLQAMLATLGGARDVSVRTKGNFHQASMRYAGATGELVSALRQSLRPIAAGNLPPATITNDFEITFN